MFEAYVSAESDATQHIADMWAAEDEAVNAREMSLGMMKELENVLAVRKERKERVRNERRMRRREKRENSKQDDVVKSLSQAPLTSDTGSEEVTKANEASHQSSDTEHYAIENSSPSHTEEAFLPDSLGDAKNHEQKNQDTTTESMTHEDTTDSYQGPELSARHSLHSQSAAKAAAIAASSRRSKPAEETFGSDSDSDCIM